MCISQKLNYGVHLIYLKFDKSFRMLFLKCYTMALFIVVPNTALYNVPNGVKLTFLRITIQMFYTRMY